MSRFVINRSDDDIFLSYLHDRARKEPLPSPITEVFDYTNLPRSLSLSQGEVTLFTHAFGRPELNQDCIGVHAEGNGVLLCVCDGMGKHGEKAAALTARVLCQTPIQDSLTKEPFHEIAQKLEYSEFRKGKTCAGVARIVGNELQVVRIGDVKIMVLRGSTVVYETVDQNDPYQQNFVTNAIRSSVYGYPSFDFSLQTFGDQSSFPLEAGDRVLVFSDGLTKTVGNHYRKDVLPARLGKLSALFPQSEDFAFALLYLAQANQEKKFTGPHEYTADNLSLVVYQHGHLPGASQFASLQTETKQRALGLLPPQSQPLSADIMTEILTVSAQLGALIPPDFFEKTRSSDEELAETLPH